MLKFFVSFGVILKFFEAKRCNFLIKTCKATTRFSVVELIVLQLKTTKFLRKCTEVASKTKKNFDFLAVQAHFEAFSFYKLNLSRDESSPIQQICPCFRRFNILVHEVCQCFDKNVTKLVKIGNFSKICLFRCQFRTVFV